MSKGKILFQLSGSIACYKACFLISKLVQEDFEVQTVASKAALEFIGNSTLEGLSGRPVFMDTFEAKRSMDHIHLSKWADIKLLCPATANSINKLANGIADDVIGTLFLTHDFSKQTYIIAPSMNQAMYNHPATQASINRLIEWGVNVLPTDFGHQACGDYGAGRLLDLEKIFTVLIESIHQ